MPGQDEQAKAQINGGYGPGQYNPSGYAPSSNLIGSSTSSQGYAPSSAYAGSVGSGSYAPSVGDSYAPSTRQPAAKPVSNALVCFRARRCLS